ncbi:MAG: hypothetical protein MUP71_00425 [Candidatus Aminicenantes bacterium]|nr:hypothetical protein [Candidatus Aminicenantes bacterium]
MNNEHLTDEQIQNILDTGMLKAGSILPLHLGTCANCQKRLDSFRQLYAGLAADPGFALPPAFADSVLDKISASRPVFWERPAAKIAMAIGTAAVILAGLLIFMDMKPLARGTLQVFDTLKTTFLPLSVQIKQLFFWVGGNAKPFILGGLGLLSAALVDHFLSRQVMRHNP